MAKKTYFVQEPLQHDGESYSVGSEISLDTKLAAGLLESGVISTAAPVVESTDESAQVAGESESPAE